MARLSIQTAATVGIMVIAVVGCKEPAPMVTPAPTPTAYAAREVYATLVALDAVDPGSLEYLLKENKRVRIRGQVSNSPVNCRVRRACATGRRGSMGYLASRILQYHQRTQLWGGSKSLVQP